MEKINQPEADSARIEQYKKVLAAEGWESQVMPQNGEYTLVVSKGEDHRIFNCKTVTYCFVRAWKQIYWETVAQRKEVMTQELDLSEFNDGTFAINLRTPGQPEKSIILLNTKHACIGCAEPVSNSGQWKVSVDAPLDPVTDSDCRLVGHYPTQMEAVHALWAERHSI